MTNSKVTSGLVQAWVNVTDKSGRSHLEARWVTPEIAAQLHATHAA